MEENFIAFISYMGGGFFFTLLTITFVILWKQKVVHSSLALASGISAIWGFSIAANYQFFTLERPALILIETIRYGAWIQALLITLEITTGQKLPFKFRSSIQATWLVCFITTLTIIVTEHKLATNSSLLIWNSLILSILGLICVEQLFKNTREHRFTKLLSISIGALFIYDIYLFSYSLVFNQIDIGLWQSRGIVNGFAAIVFIVGAIIISSRDSNKSILSVSRPVAFYTTSMTVAGSFLALMAVGGYYVQLYGGSWGNLIQIVVLFTTIFAITTLFVSTTILSSLNVWINKNFFRHKYDYRVEWLNLINSLTQPNPLEDFNELAIKVVASVFKNQGGCLWLEDHGRYIPVQSYNLNLPDIDMTEPVDTPFCVTMKEKEWVFSPYASTEHSLSEANELLPNWIFEIPELWLALPLLIEQKLIGFMILVDPEHDAKLTWEDLDLLKTVGRQVASYLDRHQAAEQLAESKQFDAFNKLTAFIMHDLKNLIAQQALVVENAAKHKENPAFVEDAIKTIDNSVSRMSNLLRKLQQQEGSDVRSLYLHNVLMDAAKKCQENKPTPSLRLETKELKVVADQDQLVMTLANFIQNAQEATSNTGFIDLTLRQEDKNAIIIVEDNGSGMDEDFIRNRLFKPFDTTKSGKGMGIGMYQSREFIANLGGSIEVTSTLNEGTVFTLSIPVDAH